MIAMIDFALAVSSPRRSVMSESNCLASATKVAAGRACRPVGLGIRTASELSARPPAIGPASADAWSSTISATTSCPAVTMPVIGVRLLIASELVTTTWVSRLRASLATVSRSKAINSSPTLTCWPALTLAWNPLPPIRTVSRPMCSKTSSPSAERMVTACLAGWTLTTSPSIGARSTPLSGSMEMPSPTIFLAKTGSGTISMGTRMPVSGAMS